jgi:hypothetical protein
MYNIVYFVFSLLGVSNLRRYFQNFRVNEGYLWSVDQLIRIKAQELTELEKIVTIQFDEVHLKSDINYDAAEDQIVGPHSMANVAEIRGVFLNFKIPVWYAKFIYSEKAAKFCKISNLTFVLCIASLK